MKTESLLIQKSSSTPSSKAHAEIFNVHRLLLAQKPFTKTRTLGTKNHPRSLVLQLRRTASTHIDYWWLRNCWWKLSPSCPKNHPRNPVLRLTLKSSMCIDYCWVRNRLPKLGPWDPKIIQEAQFNCWRWHLLRTKTTAASETVDENWVTVVTKISSTPSSKAHAEIFNVHRLLLAQKPFTKTRTLGPKNHSRSPVLRLTLTSSAHIDYGWLRNCWWKLSPCCPKNNPPNPVLRLTLKSSMCIDYCWLKNRLSKLGP